VRVKPKSGHLDILQTAEKRILHLLLQKAVIFACDGKHAHWQGEAARSTAMGLAQESNGKLPSVNEMA
jgi:hypothetical protein